MAIPSKKAPFVSRWLSDGPRPRRTPAVPPPSKRSLLTGEIFIIYKLGGFVFWVGIGKEHEGRMGELFSLGGLTGGHNEAFISPKADSV